MYTSTYIVMYKNTYFTALAEEQISQLGLKREKRNIIMVS